MPAFADVADVATRVGEAFGPSRWMEVGQQQVDAFASATGDHQWIHVDPVRAAASAFGGTIAHGFLTLSSIPVFAAELLTFGVPVTGINYGLNRVRFPAPVPTGARIRGTVIIAGATPIDGGVQVLEHWTIEIEDSSRPACVAECIVQFRNEGDTP